jgi:hypothetical protein
MKVTCGNHHRKEPASDVNGFGGMCTCPDGQSYEVGAIGDCASLACEGGFPGACEREEKVERQGMKVTCARGNYYRRDANTGVYGGECTCPDGKKYLVGDNGDDCATLACEGGTWDSGACMPRSTDWERVNMKVTCMQP